LLAQSPVNLWWTGDLGAAEVAKSELGVERTWTQAIVEHITSLGLIDRSVADEAFAKLVGFDYSRRALLVRSWFSLFRSLSEPNENLRIENLEAQLP
jgi:hypothetical protein